MLELLFDEYHANFATEKAYRVSVDGRHYWLPKSQCKDLDTHKHTIMVADWLIRELGLTEYCLDIKDK